MTETVGKKGPVNGGRNKTVDCLCFGMVTSHGAHHHAFSKMTKADINKMSIKKMNKNDCIIMNVQGKKYNK
jgi:hypothetical protein